MRTLLTWRPTSKLKYPVSSVVCGCVTVESYVFFRLPSSLLREVEVSRGAVYRILTMFSCPRRIFWGIKGIIPEFTSVSVLTSIFTLVLTPAFIPMVQEVGRLGDIINNRRAWQFFFFFSNVKVDTRLYQRLLGHLTSVFCPMVVLEARRLTDGQTFFFRMSKWFRFTGIWYSRITPVPFPTTIFPPF